MNFGIHIAKLVGTGSLIGCLLCFCTHPTANGPKTEDITYKPLYAQNFIIAKEGGNHVLYLRSNEHTAYQRYIVDTATQDVVCLSTTHIAYLQQLGMEQHIRGVSGLKYIYTRQLPESVRDVGYEAAINMETMLELKPQVVFAYNIQGQSVDYLNRMKKLGLNVIPIPDFTEAHPLGKAEYLILFAEFFNLRQEAEVQFQAIVGEYTDLKTKVDKEKQAPCQVLVNAPFKDIWYVPGKDSYISQLISDAGGNLLGAREGTQSTVIGTESVYLYAMQSDFWLHPNQFTLKSELLQLDQQFSEIPCVKDTMTKRLWNNNLRCTSQGGSDFYESGAVHPQLILADLIAIFQPQILPNHSFTYYRPLQ